MSPRDGVNGALRSAAGPPLTFCSRRAAEIERRSASGGSKRHPALAPATTRTISGLSYPLHPPRLALFKSAAIFLVLVFFPIGLSAGRYWLGESRGNWQTADRSSAGLLPLPSQHTEAIIRVYGARTVRWKAIFAIHTWIVVKEANASTYTRYDYTAWGEPIRTNDSPPTHAGLAPSPKPLPPSTGRKPASSFPKSGTSSRTTSFALTATTTPGRGRTPTPSSRPCWMRFPNSGPCCHRPPSARTIPIAASGSG